MTYAEKLKDPRWQKKRLEVFERDGWECHVCQDKESTLHVHHRRYIDGYDPWEYPLEELVTLCETCHGEESREKQEMADWFLIQGVRKNFLNKDILLLVNGFLQLELQAAPRTIAGIIGHFIGCPDCQKVYLDKIEDVSK